MDILYTRIRQRRIELGMSQEELARKLGYKGRDSICKLEKGKADLPTFKVNQFAEALDTSAAWLLGIEEDEEKESTPTVDPERQRLIDLVLRMSPEQVRSILILLDK